MGVIGKFCGRKFSHPAHSWSQSVIGLAEARWPLFQCLGLTEDEARNMAQRPTEDLEESTEDALRRYADIVAKIDQFINNEDNQLVVEEHKHDADGTPYVKVVDISKIIHPEE